MDNTSKIVPAIFLVDDIKVPGIMYPTNGPGGPECPNDGETGFGKAVSCSPDRFGETGPWNYAQLGYVVGRNMSNVFAEFEKIQQPVWNWGVFYGTSANSDSARCRWLPQYNGYDCPGYWLPWNDTISKDVSKGGSASFNPGNPSKDATWGGGSGCHFATYDPKGGIDQTDAYDPNNKNSNLVGGPHCDCNENLRTGGARPWDAWVEQWFKYAQPKPNFKWQGWFKGGKAPSFALDFAACWVNNPRDMILMQNAVWYRAGAWNNQKIPTTNWAADAASQRSYWGWNEVPMGKDLDQPKYWDAIVIKLPLAICGKDGADDTASCLGGNGERMLEDDLVRYVQAGFLKVGRNFTQQRPGSSVVFLREIQKDSVFSREFFCQPWTSPSGKYHVVHTNSSCFLDHSNTTSIMV